MDGPRTNAQKYQNIIYISRNIKSPGTPEAILCSKSNSCATLIVDLSTCDPSGASKDLHANKLITKSFYSIKIDKVSLFQSFETLFFFRLHALIAFSVQ